MALELCACTLKDIIPNRSHKEYTVGITDKGILCQMVSGLVHLHTNEIIHGDLKPENVLFSLPVKDNKLVVIKLADFGISRIVSAGKNTEHSKEELSNDTLRRFGTDGWIPHEMYIQSEYTKEVGKAADVWSLGCLFVFTLLDGKHPFGQDISSRIQLVKNKQQMLPAIEQLLKEKRAQEMINSMLQIEPKKRPTAKALLENQYFKESELNIISQIEQKRKRTSSPSQYETSSSLSKAPKMEPYKRTKWPSKAIITASAAGPSNIKSSSSLSKAPKMEPYKRTKLHSKAIIAASAAGSSNIKSRLRGRPL